jgi:hypothetical protein
VLSIRKGKTKKYLSPHLVCAANGGWSLDISFVD